MTYFWHKPGLMAQPFSRKSSPSRSKPRIRIIVQVNFPMEIFPRFSMGEISKCHICSVDVTSQGHGEPPFGPTKAPRGPKNRLILDLGTTSYLLWSGLGTHALQKSMEHGNGVEFFVVVIAWIRKSINFCLEDLNLLSRPFLSVEIKPASVIERTIRGPLFTTS